MLPHPVRPGPVGSARPTGLRQFTAGPADRPRQILIIEDHPVYRMALRSVLDAAAIPVLDEAPSIEAVPEATWRQFPVVLLDLGLPGLCDAAAVSYLVAMGLRVLVLSGHTERDVALAALSAGAQGYLSKDADGVEIVRAVRAVAAGGGYVTPTVARTLLARPRSTTPQPALSPREREVLVLLASGSRDYDIARDLDISIRTVRSHLDRIRDKTGCRRRPDLTRYAVEHGLLTWDSAADAHAPTVDVARLRTA